MGNGKKRRELTIALIGVTGGLVGVLVGALITGVFSYMTTDKQVDSTLKSARLQSQYEAKRTTYAKLFDDMNSFDRAAAGINADLSLKPGSVSETQFQKNRTDALASLQQVATDRATMLLISSQDLNVQVSNYLDATSAWTTEWVYDSAAYQDGRTGRRSSRATSRT